MGARGPKCKPPAERFLAPSAPTVRACRECRKDESAAPGGWFGSEVEARFAADLDADEHDEECH